MDTLIEVYRKNVYGRPLFYPNNELARQQVALLGKKTFNQTDLDRLEAMGFTVKNLSFTPKS